jgi:hypothetical protein
MANPYRDRQGRFATPEVGKQTRYDLLFARFLDPNRVAQPAPDLANAPKDQEDRAAMLQFIWGRYAPSVEDGA